MESVPYLAKVMVESQTKEFESLLAGKFLRGHLQEYRYTVNHCSKYVAVSLTDAVPRRLLYWGRGSCPAVGGSPCIFMRVFTTQRGVVVSTLIAPATEPRQRSLIADAGILLEM